MMFYSVVHMTDRIYKVVFHQLDQVIEVYARHIYQSDLYNFIEVEEFIFGEKSQIVVDPAEEKLKTEFQAVKRSYIPIHAVIRIDEVEREGEAKITPLKNGKVAAFPPSHFNPKKPEA